MEDGIVCGQTTSGLGDFLANVALVEAVQVDLNVALQISPLQHCFATVGTAKATISISKHHGLEGRIQV